MSSTAKNVCSAITKKGDQCRNRPMHNSTYCWNHRAQAKQAGQSPRPTVLDVVSALLDHPVVRLLLVTVGLLGIISVVSDALNIRTSLRGNQPETEFKKVVDAMATTQADQLVLLQTRLPSGFPPNTAVPTPLATPQVHRMYGFDCGIEAQVWGEPQLGVVEHATKDLGVHWVKFSVPWKLIEPTQGTRNWTQIDAVINHLSSAGLGILVTVSKAPDWARPANTDWGPPVEGVPADPGTLADFLEAFGQRYSGRVQAIEVWNEQNLWYQWGHEPLDPGRYVTMLCRAYQAIKAADPGMVVVAGALTPTGVNDGAVAIDDVAYLQHMYAAGAKKCFDAVGAHTSGYNNPPDAKYGYSNPAEPSFKNHRSFFFRDTMESYRAVMVANGDSGKQIWPTSFGWGSSLKSIPGYEYLSDNTPAEQAQFTVKAYQMMQDWGWIGPSFLWNLNYAMTDPGTELDAWSILDPAGKGRPVYDALAASANDRNLLCLGAGAVVADRAVTGR
ncbi:MAG: beta-galactosidase [Chloroflexi bacterium]|nr:beta-galactosidase [Chloroflexota bacterium]